MIWYYIASGERHGPVSDEDMAELGKSGVVDRDTLVWRDGMTDWAAAGETELADRLASTPPPIPPEAAAPPETPSAEPETGSGTQGGPPPLPGSASVPPADTGSAPETGAPPLSPSSAASGLAGLAGWASGMLISLMIALCIMIFARFGQLGVVNTIAESGVTDGIMTEAADADSFVGLAENISLLVSVVAAVLFLIWTYRAMRNLHLAGAPVTIGAGWAVGWYFIPVANLWKPLQAMTEIFRASRAPQTPHSVRVGGLLGWWWGLALGAIFMALLGTTALGNAENADATAGGIVFLILADLLDLVSAFLAIRILRAVTLDQARNGFSTDGHAAPAGRAGT